MKNDEIKWVNLYPDLSNLMKSPFLESASYNLYLNSGLYSWHKMQNKYITYYPFWCVTYYMLLLEITTPHWTHIRLITLQKAGLNLVNWFANITVIQNTYLLLLLTNFVIFANPKDKLWYVCRSAEQITRVYRFYI